jgi:PAS domain S-box-containing protein
MAIYDEVFYLYGTLDPSGTIRELKGQGLIDAGLHSENLSGKELSLLAPWEANPQAVKDAVVKAASGQPASIEAEFYLSAENSRSLKLTFTPVTREKNKVYEIFFTAQDIGIYNSELSFYKNRSEQLLFAAETAEIGLFFWDLQKDELFTTPKFNELYGFSATEIMTRDKFSRVIHPDDVDLVNKTIQNSHAGFGECNVEYRVVIDGKIRWILIRGKTFPDTGNSAAFTMGSARDITQGKLSGEEITKLLTSEKLARDNVEHANRAKDHFIAMVSHELRAPLNSILGWVKILLTKEVDDETRINALETIERSARSQAKLIGDLVDSSQIISGKLNLEFHPVNVPDAIAYVVESQKPAAQAKNIALNYLVDNEEVMVNADLNRLQQVFVNLLTNAVKFTPNGGMISVFVEKEPDNVRISIEDTGKGIRIEELPHIFENYYQAGVSESGDKSGLGLGLSIVSSLVRQHGGTVKAESRGIGQGAKFTVTFPLLNKTVAMPRSEEKFEFSEEPLDTLRILLVEDNDDSREVLQIFFEQRGAQVAATSSVAEAMENLSSGGALPDVIVSDISMPDEDGYSFIRKVRSSPKIKNIPAIALTALVSIDDERKLLASGYQYHHPKPFESERLIKEILEAVK